MIALILARTKRTCFKSASACCRLILPWNQISSCSLECGFTTSLLMNGSANKCTRILIKSSTTFTPYSGRNFAARLFVSLCCCTHQRRRLPKENFVSLAPETISTTITTKKILRVIVIQTVYLRISKTSLGWLVFVSSVTMSLMYSCMRDCGGGATTSQLRSIRLVDGNRSADGHI